MSPLLRLGVPLGGTRRVGGLLGVAGRLSGTVSLGTGESGLVLSEEGNPAGLSSCSGGLRPLVELCASATPSVPSQPEGNTEGPGTASSVNLSKVWETGQQSLVCCSPWGRKETDTDSKDK